MKALTTLKHLRLRDIWAHEANDFTPWLADNIRLLGEALGMDLELQGREAAVGEFSLDLLAKEIGSNRVVIIENQIYATDHDHLGKLLTYASGFDARVVIWVAESIRDEHRQALEWLNERTDAETEFFGIAVEVLQIDESRPAVNFRPVVFPNDWRKGARRQVTDAVTPLGEAYRKYFQALIDELREKHRFTNARMAQPQNWYAFSSGTSGIKWSAVFGGDGVRAELYIDVGEAALNKAVFDQLLADKDAIERECGVPLNWVRMEDRRAARICTSRPGTIEQTSADLEATLRWQVDSLLMMRRVFGPRLKPALRAAEESVG